MSKGIQPYVFPATGQQVRSVLIADEVLFVGKDAAETLGHANPQRAVREHVPAAHRRVTESVTPSDLGLDPQTVLITEAGLYRLIMRSNTEVAEAFQEWVTAEVLPAIRKTGSYSVAPQRELSRKELALLVIQAEEEKERLELENAELRPKAEVYDMTMDTEGLTGMTALGAMVGTSAKAVTTWMVERGWFFKQPSQGGGKQHMPHVGWVRSGHFTVRREDDEHSWRVYHVAYATNLGVDMFVKEWKRDHPVTSP